MTNTVAVKADTKPKKRLQSKYHEGDFGMIITAAVLSLFGLVMVFSASYYTGLSKFNDAFYYLKDDLKWLVFGWAVFAVFAFIDYHVWQNKVLNYIILGAGFLCLIALLVLPSSLKLTVTLNGATRWINVFGLFTFMPGEVIKFCFILFYAAYYSEYAKRTEPWVQGFVIPIGIGGAAFLLIFAQPNLSTACIVIVMVVALMFIAGISWVKLVAAIGLGIVGVIGLVVLKGADYMIARLDNFWDPFADSLGKGYQVCQSLLAFGSGGVTGVGLGNSVQKALYLPEAMNDFILPIIGEELGFIGVLLLIIVYVFLLYRLVHIAMLAKDRMGTLLAAGVAVHLGLQVILNIAVVTASFPPTGVVLPLISLGGTATALIMAELGIAYNVSRQSRVISK